MLIAAAEPVGDPALVWRAAERLGIGVDAAAPRETSDLCEFGARVRFRHPLVRSAVYRAASSEDRQAVHRALAEVTDPGVDLDRRAWHRAHATPGPDEDVAEELERSAGRAVQEISRGIDPAILSRGGLQLALRNLARRWAFRSSSTSRASAGSRSGLRSPRTTSCPRR